MAVISELKKTYFMKDVGKSQYYLGGNVIELGPEQEKEDIYATFSAKTYIYNVMPKIAKLCRFEEFRKEMAPFKENYYPELNDTPLVPPEEISLYDQQLGSAQWLITLDKFDSDYAINTLSRYSMAPKEGHMKAMCKIFWYLI